MILNKLQVLRDGVNHLLLDIDLRTVYSHSIMAEHVITAVFVSDSPIDLTINDYIIYRTNRYEINQPVRVEKQNDYTFVYTARFESQRYRLFNKILQHNGDVDISYYGDATAFVQLIVDNMNDIDSGWTVGTVSATDERHIDFISDNRGGTNCRDALTKVAETFSLEFYVSGKAISLVEAIGVDTAIDFSVGKGNGLYVLERFYNDDFQEFNRLLGFGGETNIPAGYRGGQTRLSYTPGYEERALDPGEIRRESSIIFDDIFPNRTAQVETVVDDFSFTDSTIDFDLNDQFILGETAKVVFKSGILSGWEFDIASYDHSTKTITILPKDENGEQYPRPGWDISIGMDYTLVDIELPNSYIVAAEAALELRTKDRFSKTVKPSYSGIIDQKFLQSYGIWIEAGDRVTVTDSDIGFNDLIRINTVSYSICWPYEIDIVLSDEVTYTYQQRIVADQERMREIIKESNLTNYELARRNSVNLRNLVTEIYDADGYFDTGNIRPGSIETGALAVGAKWANFSFNNIEFDANTGGNPNTFTATSTSGQLVHYEVEIEGLGYIWAMTGGTFSGLTAGNSYYVYARCSKTVLTGEFVVTTDIIKTEDPLYPGVYNFLIGTLFPVQNGYRSFYMTKGATFIIGDTINTGRIKSIDGNNYFDLTQSRFKIGGTQSGLDWNVTRPGTLQINGAIVQSRNMSTIDYLAVYRGDYSAVAFYFRGDVVKYNGSWYKYINASVENISGIVPTNATYWRLTADKGDQGVPGMPGPSGADGADGAPGPAGPAMVYRGNYAGGTTYYGNSKRVDVVYYGGQYYVARTDAPGGSFSGILPTNGAYWNTFGATFDSIATGLLLAQISYIENLVARYIQTSAPGTKRVEINERREKRNSSGGGTGVFEPQNNVALFNASNAKLAEIDDDSSPGLGIFYLEFNTFISFVNFRGIRREWDHSAFNANFVGTNNSAWAHGNFSNGFPRFVLDLVYSNVGGTYRYYFRYPVQGFNSSDPNDDYFLLPNTSVGNNVSNLNNTNLIGSVARGHTRIYPTEGLASLDSGNFANDSDIIFTSSSNLNFAMPVFISGGYLTSAVGTNHIGRVVTFINKGSGLVTLTATTSGMFINTAWTDVNTIAISTGETVVLKLISKSSVPTAISDWRWCVIKRAWN